MGYGLGRSPFFVWGGKYMEILKKVYRITRK
jgi:hypothetical protein